MVSGCPELPPNLDLGALGKTMLDAAEAAHIGVTVTFVDGARPKNVYVSRAASEILGWPVEDLLAGDPMSFVAPEDLARLIERLGKRAGGEAGHASYEVAALRKDGGTVPIELSATNTTIDGRRAIMAFLVDLSARKAAESARVRSEARFRELIEAAPEPIGIFRDGHFVYANPALVSTLGYDTPPELYRVALAAMVVPEEVDVLGTREKLIVEKGLRLPTHTYRGQRKDGSVILLEMTTVPIEYEGLPAALTMGRDVTARRALEAQLVQSDRLAALGTMAAGVAHEVNNPLAYVMLNLEWIARKMPQAAGDADAMGALTEVLREARGGVERVATIVRELRSFSRADGDSRHRVDLAGVAQSAIRMAAHEIRHRANVVTSFEPVRPIWANEARLEQVLLNLLLNATQALPEARAPDNEIRVSVYPDEGGNAVLEVADNGEGIRPDVLPRIFDPFFTTKAPGVGTGLGLSICHGIVTSLGGHIAVQSADGQGTRFMVTLPTTDAPEPAARPPSEAPVSRGERRARVLVVDDEVPIANTMRELLGTDHDVTAVTSGRDALLALARSSDFDVVFCDLMMPVMSGIDLFHRIRETHPGVEQRVVFMTGGAFTTRAAEFLASIDNRRVEKPFSLKAIERIVRDMMGPDLEAPTERLGVFLNVDLGELAGESDSLYASAHVANIACGGHAGDEETMRCAIEMCRALDARVGAHPSYPDREGFGRVELPMPVDSLRASVAGQCARLAAVARIEGQPVRFLKPHGALYHAAARDRSVARALIEGAKESLGRTITVIGPGQSALADEAMRASLGFAREGFADRALRADGSLVPRGEPGALLTDPAAAAEQALSLAAGRTVDTVCVHGDTPGAVAIARAVRAALDAIPRA
jgi:PAS domain S-box-containing protein